MKSRKVELTVKEVELICMTAGYYMGSHSGSISDDFRETWNSLFSKLVDVKEE